MVAEPKCPSCLVQGIQYVIASESQSKTGNGDAWFEIAHCSQCGHVYGVFAKIIHAPTFRRPYLDPSRP